MNSTEHSSVDQHKIPAWVSEALSLDEARIAHLAVSAREPAYRNSTYWTLLNYVAHRAVDSDVPSVPTSPMNHVKINSSKLRKLRREFPGQLNSLSIPDVPIRHMLKKPPPKFGKRDDEESTEPQYPTYNFGQGRAKVMYEESLVCVSHIPSTSLNQDNMIYFYAPSSEILRKFVDSVHEWLFLKEQPDRKPRVGKYELYTIDIGIRDINWKRHGWQKGRNLDTIFLPKGIMADILEDFHSFHSEGTKDWYFKHGLPHRRSYLFHGAAGTGKTSTIRGLAGKLKLAACFLELGDHEVTNSHLTTALRKIPQPAMLVIEDVDAIFTENRKTKNLRSPLTFSGLLNALDGLLSTDGILTVLTTNHPERLDPALIRAGRIDRKFEFKQPGKAEFVAMFQSYYEDADIELAKEFGTKVFARTEKEAKSIATLTELFIYTRELGARECVDKMDEFFSKFYPLNSIGNCDHLYS